MNRAFLVRADFDVLFPSALFRVDIGTETRAAVLPSSRSVQIGTPATAFATIVNPGPRSAVGCRITPASSIAANFVFQTTNPATNQVTGTPNTPVDIPPGAGQTFVIALTPTEPVAPTDVQLRFDCSNSDLAPMQSGLNTLFFSASATPVPDIVALAATLDHDGVVKIPGAPGTGVFASGNGERRRRRANYGIGGHGERQSAGSSHAL